MTEDDYGEGRDPLLVRPFLLRDGGGAPADASGASVQTWPSATTREVRSHSALEGADDPTAVLVLPASPPRRRDVRRRLVVLAVVGVAVLLGAGAAGFAALRPDTGAPIAAVLPDAPLALPAGPHSGSPSASAAAGPAAHRSSGRSTAHATPSAARARATAATPATVTGTSPASTGSPAAKAPPAAAIPAPAVVRTGKIHGPGGLCLDVAGGKPAGGSRVEVDDCTGSDTQTWTVTGDGTMRVSDTLCAVQAGDGTVRLAACDGSSAAQWSVSGAELVNDSSTACLTDPAGGSTPGTTVLVTVCTDATNQHWSVP